jgi:hypothetical protein
MRSVVTLAVLLFLGTPSAGRSQESGDAPEAHAHHPMSMTGFFGPYPVEREASGTSWQPDATPHEGIHLMVGEWMLMLHGFGMVVFDTQGGPRGGHRVFGPDMFMAMADQPLGGGTFGLRTMVSLEPATIGTAGYPLLLQTGETADGKTPLIDRQHPHDLFMELATSYSHPLSDAASVFVYFGLPGEPALGPPAFVHRGSATEIPEAPIAHHWLDSTHVTYGVATVGVVDRGLKVEGSFFRGREPDQHRWNIESPRFDSYSGRITLNPGEHWSLQASAGHLKEPEALEPGVDVDRVTASAAYSAAGGRFQTMLAWGHNHKSTGQGLGAFLLEATVKAGPNTLFGRAEVVQKDELFISGPFAGKVFDCGKISAGYTRDLFRQSHSAVGLGGLLSVVFVPSEIRPAYGGTPLSGMLFVRAALR